MLQRGVVDYDLRVPGKIIPPFGSILASAVQSQDRTVADDLRTDERHVSRLFSVQIHAISML